MDKYKFQHGVDNGVFLWCYTDDDDEDDGDDDCIGRWFRWCIVAASNIK